MTRLDQLLDTLERLLREPGGGPHLSFYVESGRRPEQGRRARIVFRNQLSEARARVAEEGRGEAGIERALRTCEAWLDDADFWANQEGGLAVFLHSGGAEMLLTRSALPDKWVYSSDFHLKPLLAAAAHADAYWLLTLSQNKVRLFRGSQLGFREVECKGLPENYADAMHRRGYGADSVIMATTESRRKAGREHLRLFFQTVNGAVHELLSSSELPLLVAGVDHYAPLYREVNTYPNLSEGFLEGNVERMSASELHRKASEVLKDDFKQSQLGQLRRYKEASHTGTALDKLDLILAASARGQIEVLFVPTDEECWGTFDPAKVAIVQRDEKPGLHNTDLYELAARQTLDTGGEVYFLEAAKLPVDRKCIALLRWIGEGENPHCKP